MNTVADGLRALIARGFLFQQINDDNGHLAVLVGSYGWQEFYDRIHIHDEDSAVAARAPIDSPPGAAEVVWSHEGDASSAIHALLELPRPDEPGAPRRVHRAPSGLWVPGNGQAPFDLHL